MNKTTSFCKKKLFYIPVLMTSGFFFIFASFSSIRSIEYMQLLSPPINLPPKWSIILAAGILFFLSHIIRSLRLWIMLIEDIKSFSQILSLHFLSSWIVTAIPFKIGEVFRLVQFIKITNNSLEGAAVFIIEKFMDAIVVLILIALGASIMSMALEVRFLTLFLVFSILSSLLLWKASPGLITYSRRIILTKSQSEKGILALHLLNFYEKLLEIFKRKIDFRFTLLLLMSILSWLIDAAAFSFLGDIMGLSSTEIYKQIVTYLENSILHNPSKIYAPNAVANNSMGLSSYFSTFSILMMTVAILIVTTWRIYSIITPRASSLTTKKRVQL